MIWREVLGNRFHLIIIKDKNKVSGLSTRANYTDRATATCRRSEFQLLWIEDA
jgi:hypothetical protein